MRIVVHTFCDGLLRGSISEKKSGLFYINVFLLYFYLFFLFQYIEIDCIVWDLYKLLIKGIFIKNLSSTLKIYNDDKTCPELL